MADSTILTLTQAVTTESKFISFTTPVNASQGLSITFDFYAYGGTGGDGISFSLIDGSKSPTQAGAFGGSLGYAQLINSGIPGLEGGYLGIGFDAFGNFATALDERIDGGGSAKDAVTVRGSEATQYKFLATTGSIGDFSIDNPGPTATRENSKRTANIKLSNTGQLLVSLDLNGDGDTVDDNETVLNFNVLESGNGALPSTFKFGFAASTGAETNVHEIGNLDVRTFDGVPIQQGTIDSNLLIRSDGVSNTLDPLTGAGGDDTLVGGLGRDLFTGNEGADRFVFSGVNKALALRSSTVRSLDRITDFDFSEGDRFQLDFDNNLDTVERPKALFNAGKLRGSITKAAQAAYQDKDQKRAGNQALKGNEAVFFQRGSRTYLSVNDSNRRFSITNDLVVDVTGIEFRSGDLNRGKLVLSNYFA